MTLVLPFSRRARNLTDMDAKTKQQIRDAALAMGVPFTLTGLKMKLSTLVMGSASPKSREWRDVLDELVSEGKLVVVENGAAAPLGGSEGQARERKYKAAPATR